MHNSASDFVQARRKRHDALVRTHPRHYLSSAAACVSDILAGLPGTVHVKILKGKYTPDSSTNTTVANKLLSKVFELLPPAKRIRK